MKENLFVLGLFFIFVPVLIFSQMFLLFSFRSSEEVLFTPQVLSDVTRADDEKLAKTNSIFAANTVNKNQLETNVTSADSRPLLIKNYLQKFNSELEPYADLIFEASQKYGLDYRLTTAIAQQESNLCRKAPENCFNCWGVGIHSRGTMCFDSYPKAIDWLSRYLKEEYYDLGLNSVEEIQSKYCPLSSGSWAAGVKQFMADIEASE